MTLRFITFLLLVALPVPALAQEQTIEGMTGWNGGDLIALHMAGEGGSYVLYYLADRVPPTQRPRIAGNICASSGMRAFDIQDLPLEAGEDVPGARRLVVQCQ